MASSDLLEAFGPYLLLRTLGRGGMGVVYVARSPREAHPIVAVKRLRADAARVPSFAERFEHECALALRLRHENLVETLDAGEIGGAPFVASQLVRGQNLGELALRLRERGAGAPLAAVLRILVDALSALHYVHTAREEDGRPLVLVHRDVTPGNILVGYDGRSRLADFGLAKSLLSEHLGLTTEGTILGTPSFLAPEMATGGVASPQTDLYGMGAVAYRLLTGAGPYEGQPRKVLTDLIAGPPPPIRARRPDLPDAFVQVLGMLMARRPEDRPANAQDAIDRLMLVAERTGAWVEQGELAKWVTKLFWDEKAAQDDQWISDLRVRVHDERDAGTRVLPRASGPLSGEVSVRPSHGVATRPLDAGVPLTLEPAADTVKSPSPVSAQADLQRAGLDTAPRVVSPPPNREAPTATIRPIAAPTRATPIPTPPSRGPGWIGVLVGAALAAGLGAMVATVMMTRAPVDVGLYERLGVATAMLRSRGEDASSASLEEKLRAVRVHLDAGDAVEARVLLAEIEHTLASK